MMPKLLSHRLFAAAFAAAGAVAQQEPAAATTTAPAAATATPVGTVATGSPSAAISTPVAQGTTGTPAAATASGPCAAVASSQAAALQASPVALLGDLLSVGFDGPTAYECIQSIPFNAEDSNSFLSIARQYFSLDSTLAFLKNPPPSYQQPPIDFLGRMDQIGSKAQSGGYQTQYNFDMDLFQAVVQTWEGHMAINAGVGGLFMWAIPQSFVSVSPDGKALPQIYVYSDIQNNLPNASPIVDINGQSVFSFFRNLTNGIDSGTIDPHGSFNAMMHSTPFLFMQSASGTMSPQNSPTLTQLLKLYPGASFQGHFENGTAFTWPVVAVSSRALLNEGLTSPSAIYDIFAKNITSSGGGGASVAPSSAAPTAAGTAALSTALASLAAATTTQYVPRDAEPTPPTYTSVPFSNFPNNPVIIEKNFGSKGVMSGYFLNDVSVGVLSIPTFEPENGAKEFADTITSFVQQAKAAGMKQIVIDVTGNPGGSVLSGYDAFKLFFPSIEPTPQLQGAISRTTTTLGSIVSFIGIDTGNVAPQNLVDLVRGGEQAWLNSEASTRIDGSSWNSYADFAGPVNINGSSYTNLARFKLDEPTVAKTRGMFIPGYGGNVIPYSQPWDPKDVILLTDSWCSSTCAVFAELLKTDAGVQHVVYGGIPEYGPMQSVAGTRGNTEIDWSVASRFIAAVQQTISTGGSQAVQELQQLNLTTDDLKALPPTLDKSPFVIRQGSINALNMIRAGQQDVPLAFTYEAADCRMFLTGAMVRDITQLWRAAAKFAGGDTSVCVPGSMNQPGAKPNQTITTSVQFSADKDWTNANSTSVPSMAAAHGAASSTAYFSLAAMLVTALLWA